VFVQKCLLCTPDLSHVTELLGLLKNFIFTASRLTTAYPSRFLCGAQNPPALPLAPSSHEASPGFVAHRQGKLSTRETHACGSDGVFTNSPQPLPGCSLSRVVTTATSIPPSPSRKGWHPIRFVLGSGSIEVLDTTVELLRLPPGPDQNADLQLRELNEYAGRQGWNVVEVYKDVMSGAKSSRPALNRLMADSRARKFDCVLVWSPQNWQRKVETSEKPRIWFPAAMRAGLYQPPFT